MKIQDFELRSYRRELDSIKSDYNEFFSSNDEDKNLTLFGLNHSNRIHLSIVGLCSLVEATLYEIALVVEEKQNFKLKDISGTGKTKLEKYLSRAGAIDFGQISAWSDFSHIYTLRNTFVHSYGGLVETPQLEKAKKAIELLGLDPRSLIVADKRIRIDIESLERFIDVVEKVLCEIQKDI